MSETTQTSFSCDLCGGRKASFFLEKGGARYLRCPECDFIFSDQGSEAGGAANHAYFEKTLSTYVAKAYSTKKQRAYRAKLRAFEPYRKTGLFLEVGCNVGGLLYQARETGWDVRGVEPVESCARWGRERHGLDVQACLLEEADLEEGAFDVVYSNAVLEHLPHPGRVIERMARLVRPGGVVFADTVNVDSYTWDFVGADWKLVDPQVHLCLYTPRTLRRYCEDAGLRVVKISTHGVRFRPNHAPALSGGARLMEEMRKLPWSLRTRYSLRGDSIAVLAERPAN